MQSDNGGFSELGIDTVEPILRRGVLLDIAAEMNVEELPPDFAITPHHLDEALKTAKTPSNRATWFCCAPAGRATSQLPRGISPAAKADTR